MSELLTVREVAVIMKCSEDAVSQRFAKMPGVIDLGREETRSKRRYRVLRIPKAVVEAYLSKKAGRTIHVEIPLRPERRRKHPDWQIKATLDLAKAAAQNDCKGFKDQKIFQRIAHRAQVLATVPEKLWAELMNESWFDEPFEG